MYLPIYFSIKTSDNGFEVFNDDSYEYTLDSFSFKTKLRMRKPNHNPKSQFIITNSEFLNEISVINNKINLGAYNDIYDQLMYFRNRTYFISKKYVEYKKELEIYTKKTNNRLARIRNSVRTQMLSIAYKDTTPMLKQPDLFTTCYSRSKTVNTKLNKLLQNCWQKTTDNKSTFAVRNYVIARFQTIYLTAPECAMYDYEYLADEREIFWSHFPKSWKIIFDDVKTIR